MLVQPGGGRVGGFTPRVYTRLHMATSTKLHQPEGEFRKLCPGLNTPVRGKLSRKQDKKLLDTNKEQQPFGTRCFIRRSGGIGSSSHKTKRQSLTKVLTSI